MKKNEKEGMMKSWEKLKEIKENEGNNMNLKPREKVSSVKTKTLCLCVIVLFSYLSVFSSVWPINRHLSLLENYEICLDG